MSINKKPSFWTWTAMTVAVLVALPFTAGAVVLTATILRLPDSPLGRLETARLLGAALFAFGLSLGLIGSVVALTSTAATRQALATATTLFGCAHLLLGIIVRRSLEDAFLNMQPSVLPVMLPVLLWGYSVWLAVRAAKMEQNEQSQASEEQLQGLSRS